MSLTHDHKYLDEVAQDVPLSMLHFLTLLMNHLFVTLFWTLTYVK